MRVVAVLLGMVLCPCLFHVRVAGQSPGAKLWEKTTPGWITGPAAFADDQVWYCCLLIDNTVWSYCREHICRETKKKTNKAARRFLPITIYAPVWTVWGGVSSWHGTRRALTLGVTVL